MPLANRLVASPPAKLCGGKGSGKGEGPLRFLPSPVCLLRYVGLEQEFAGGGTVLEHHGIGHGFEPLHTLRHFYATYLLQEGTSKQVAASLLGHADTAFLERTYCHPQAVAKQQAAKLMQDLLNNQNPCYVAFMKNKNRKAKKAG